MTAYEETLQDLVSKLKELFQMDQADLDFGIYRVMRAKHDEIDKFLTKDLLPTVKKTLEATGKSQNRQKELDEIVSNLRNAGIDPDSSPKVQELKALLENGGSNSENDAKDIFSNLITFFSRYYSGGDFISLRRYKKDTYSPLSMNGEEVKLHWANADQYYIKSSENLTNYAFVDDPDSTNPLNVKFVLVAATTEQNNNKSQEGEIVFTLASGSPFEYLSYKHELSIKFEYQVDAKKRKQKDINAGIVKHIEKLTDLSEFPQWPEIQSRLLSLRATKANPKRTLIEKHLTDFTSKNKFDYFIHKDLGGFLNKELDYFIKSELVKLDDIIPSAPTELNDLGLLLEKQILTNELQLKKIIALKSIAQKIIQFLAQLENFQKKLWVKKKFVLGTDWLISLNKIKEISSEYKSTILNCESQIQQWCNDYAFDRRELISDIKSLGVDGFFENDKYGLIAIDTKFHTEDTKFEILSYFDDIDSEINALLIKGENSNALSLLKESLRENLTSIYIDPPYNTGDDGFMYKDSFKSSSWISMMNNTLPQARELLNDDGSIFVSCDEHQYLELGQLLRSVFGENNHTETLTWNKRIPKNDKGIGNIHEYIYLFCKDQSSRRAAEKSFEMRKDGIDEIYELIKKLEKNKTPIADAKLELKKFYKKQGYDRGITLYSELTPDYKIWGKVNMSWPNAKTEGPRYEVISPVTGQPVPIPDNGWRWKEETFREVENTGPTYNLPDGSIMKGGIWYSSSKKVQPSSVKFLQDVESFLLRSILSLKSDGSIQLDNLGLSGLVDYPKPPKLIEWLFYASGDKSGYFCDYFAGSGTTAQAIANLNRDDNSKRKLLLIEMGEHFYSAVIPRLKKSFFARNWKKGTPDYLASEALPVFAKYIELESYEDVLSNIELSPSDGQQSLLDELGSGSFNEQYTLQYMLDIESKNQLIDFKLFNTPLNSEISIVRNNQQTKRTVDLVETFNYLLGLSVMAIRKSKGIVEVIGTTNNGDRCLILWRDVFETTNDQLDDWFKKQDYNSRDMEFDLIYVNGDNNLPNLKTGTDHWKVQLIEIEFYKLMFDVNEL
jgi:adenine-specific DNA-methyltransferase